MTCSGRRTIYTAQIGYAVLNVGIFNEIWILPAYFYKYFSQNDFFEQFVSMTPNTTCVQNLEYGYSTEEFCCWASYSMLKRHKTLGYTCLTRKLIPVVFHLLYLWPITMKCVSLCHPMFLCYWCQVKKEKRFFPMPPTIWLHLNLVQSCVVS